MSATQSSEEAVEAAKEALRGYTGDCICLRRAIIAELNAKAVAQSMSDPYLWRTEANWTPAKLFRGVLFGKPPRISTIAECKAKAYIMEAELGEGGGE